VSVIGDAVEGQGGRLGLLAERADVADTEAAYRDIELAGRRVVCGGSIGVADFRLKGEGE
jgi:hypothetical protein